MISLQLVHKNTTNTHREVHQRLLLRVQCLEPFLILGKVILLLASIDGILLRAQDVNHVIGIKVVLSPGANNIRI